MLSFPSLYRKKGEGVGEGGKADEQLIYICVD
jgi:hypothetical protein